LKRFQKTVAAVFAFMLGASEAAPQNIKDITELLRLYTPVNPAVGLAFAVPLAASLGAQENILKKHQDGVWGPSGR